MCYATENRRKMVFFTATSFVIFSWLGNPQNAFFSRHSNCALFVVIKLIFKKCNYMLTERRKPWFSACTKKETRRIIWNFFLANGFVPAEVHFLRTKVLRQLAACSLLEQIKAWKEWLWNLELYKHAIEGACNVLSKTTFCQKKS